MTKRLGAYVARHHIGLLALFIAIGGTSYAAATGSIDSREIKNNTVRSKDVRNNNIEGKDIKNESLGGADVKNGRLTGADITDNSLGTSDLGPNSVQADEIASNAVRGGEIQSGSVEGDEVRNGSLQGSDLASTLLSPVVRSKEQTKSAAAVSGPANCANGERAIGGGVQYKEGSDPGDVVTFSRPEGTSVGSPPSEGDIAVGWRAGIDTTVVEGKTPVVYVVCVRR